MLEAIAELESSPFPFSGIHAIHAQFRIRSTLANDNGVHHD